MAYCIRLLSPIALLHSGVVVEYLFLNSEAMAAEWYLFTRNRLQVFFIILLQFGFRLSLRAFSSLLFSCFFAAYVLLLCCFWALPWFFRVLQTGSSAAEAAGSATCCGMVASQVVYRLGFSSSLLFPAVFIVDWYPGSKYYILFFYFLKLG